jgi:hypothetical protein
MVKISVKCEECGHEARVPDAFAGKKVRCLRCQAKLRVPGPSGPPSGPIVALDDKPSSPGKSKKAALPTSGSLPSKLRREVLQSIREVLSEHEHAIEDSPRGFEVDLRGVAFGLARTLVEDLLNTKGVRDVKLAGGTGDCHVSITLEGADYDPDDSFADENEETEFFRRPTLEELRTPVDDASSPSQSRGKSSSRERDRDAKETTRGERGSRDVPAPPPPPSVASSSRATRADEKRSSPRDSTRPVSASSASKARPEAPPAGGPEVEKLVEEGRSFLDQGEAASAIEVLEKACRLERDNAAAVEMLGQAYARTGDHDRARRAFRHLTTLAPEDADAAIYYAAEAVACDRLDDAKEAIKTVIRLEPENPKGYKFASVLYERMGDPEKAKKFRAKYDQLKGR